MKSLAPSEFVDSLIPINKKKKLPDQLTKKLNKFGYYLGQFDY